MMRAAVSVASNITEGRSATR
ncbi:MAG: hypothetical protein RKP20_12635 [Candidatus Competibacter sp.]|nr:hypothetical protein [Candidatus Contendobacter sp.]MDS4042013.1 hypothetical protein [Candidatus Competibacter sp.]MDS4068179.1 hypothetical protein [Candidatus Competibacter sp.]